MDYIWNIRCGENGNNVKVLDVLKLSNAQALRISANVLPSIDEKEVVAARPKESGKISPLLIMKVSPESYNNVLRD